ncbi:sulfurtransferase [Thiogranum longum]
MDYRTLITVSDCLDAGLPPDWTIIDCRFDLADKTWGPSVYRDGHIIGAHYAHLEADLSGPVGARTGRHPLPDSAHFAACLARWRVGPETQVVVYDQNNGSFAARLWWMLRAAGHRAVAVLEGGWAAWLEAGGGITRSIPTPGSGIIAVGQPCGWVTTEQVRQNLASRDVLLVDARSRERFCGDVEPIDPVAGHVPGAANRPFNENLRENGAFVAPDLLKAQWKDLLEGRDPSSVIHMCGSGVTACHNLLAMEVAGLTGSRLYVGSWSEWISDTGHPVAVGPG